MKSASHAAATEMLTTKASGTGVQQQCQPPPARAPLPPLIDPPLIDPAIIDQFAPLLERKRALDGELRVLTAAGGEYDRLNQLVREAADKKPPTERLMLDGLRYQIEATPREMEASPMKLKIFKLLKRDQFLEVVSITQKAIKEKLGEKAIDSLFSKARTGSRKLTVLVKAGKAA